MKHKVLTAIFALVLLSCILNKGHEFALLAGSVATAIFILIVGSGSYHLKFNYFINSIHTSNKKGIALTFDDGPDPVSTPKLLDALAAANVKATFFLIGQNAEAHPDLVKRIDAEGHAIGNHSYCHNNWLSFYSKTKLFNDITQCNNIIASIIEKKPMFFRVPFGVTSPQYTDVLGRTGHTSIGWSLRSYDTMTDSVDKLVNTVSSQMKNGEILLLHDGQNVTTEALPKILAECKTKGIDVVPLPEFISKDAYDNA